MSTSTESNGPHGLSKHVHLLEVHQAVETGLVTLVRESHVLDQQRHEGYHWWLELAYIDLEKILTNI